MKKRQQRHIATVVRLQQQDRSIDEKRRAAALIAAMRYVQTDTPMSDVMKIAAQFDHALKHGFDDDDSGHADVRTALHELQAVMRKFQP